MDAQERGLLGEIQDYGRPWPPRRRRGWLSRTERILVLPTVAMIGLTAYFSGVIDERMLTGQYQFAPDMFKSDRDCSDFATRWEAQSFFNQAGPGDPHRLDDDGDGLVCEFNPWFDVLRWFGK